MNMRKIELFVGGLLGTNHKYAQISKIYILVNLAENDPKTKFF